MSRALQTVRKVVRFVAGLAFWLQAFRLLHVPQLPVGQWAARLNMTAPELMVVSALAIFSVLSSYGLGKLAWDLAYIYFFPLILLYHIGRVVFRGVRVVARVFGGGDSVVRESPASTSTEAGTVPKPIAQVGAIPQRDSLSKRIFLSLARPFRQFTLLWCLLLLLSSNRILLVIALMVVLAHLVRALIKVYRLALFSLTSWLSQIEAKIREHVDGLIAKLLAFPLEAEPTDDLRNVANSLNGIRIGLQILQKRRRVAGWIFILGLLVFGVMYLYIALLFAFAYFGVARVQSIAYTWGDAVVTSIFIPVAFGDLPRNIWLKLLGGVHWVCVVALGLGTVFGYFQKKLDSLYGVTQILAVRLEENEVKARMERLAEKPKLPSLPSGNVNSK